LFCPLYLKTFPDIFFQKTSTSKKVRKSFRRLNNNSKKTNQYVILDCHDITATKKNNTRKEGLLKQSDTCRGRFENTDIGHSSQAQNNIVQLLQNKIRLGDEESRVNLHNMIILHAYKCEYPRFTQQMDKYENILGIGMFPDIYVLCLRATCVKFSVTDELINFMRSSVKFFVNPRRIQKKSGWSTSDSSGLIVLLKCCLPSLLSLFPVLSSKDVHFWARVHIFRLFRTLLDGPQKLRCAFFEKNRSLLRICLVEYILYFVKFVSPLPGTSMLKEFDFDVLYMHAFNVGQQLRVDITTAYVSKLETRDADVSIDEISNILLEMNPRCQVQCGVGT
jgi:hypothetical protein